MGIGYQTNEVLQRLTRREDVIYVRGNHDQAILDIIEQREPESNGEELEHHEWIAKNLEKSYHPFLAQLPMQRSASYNEKKFLFRHYHMEANETFLPIDQEPSALKLDSIYQTEGADVVCFGHHHILHHFKSNQNQRLYLNPGALGCGHQSIAPYALMTIVPTGEIDVCVKEISYDSQEFLKGFEVLQVPARDSILKIFYGI
ncbi:metallophosphatase family protein [Radiobacillus kanasensis]|nr:metallophosphatase family protein [Radiobacillus kanasensis]